MLVKILFCSHLTELRKTSVLAIIFMENKVKKESNLYMFLVLSCFLFVATQASAAGRILKMSTTTSTQASGLLDVLLPVFNKDTGITVKVIAKGTGAAIRDGIDGNVDVIFVHAQKREEKFVADGYGTKRYGVMHNDFVVVGPPKDPAGLKGGSDAVEALTKIADHKFLFISRGDDSGTHTKEQFLWGKTDVGRSKKKGASFSTSAGLGKWYLEIGQGMGKTLTFADEKKAYTLTDRGTYLKYKIGREIPISLEILCEGDVLLANPYGVIPVNPKKHPHVNYKSAEIFTQWLVAEKGQRLIGNYKLLGEQLFFPDSSPI
jgi:tungstate transport system substrate-binding protein